jgi:hypothetical protein
MPDVSDSFSARHSREPRFGAGFHLCERQRDLGTLGHIYNMQQVKDSPVSSRNVRGQMKRSKRIAVEINWTQDCSV